MSNSLAAQASRTAESASSEGFRSRRTAMVPQNHWGRRTQPTNLRSKSKNFHFTGDMPGACHSRTRFLRRPFQYESISQQWPYDKPNITESNGFFCAGSFIGTPWFNLFSDGNEAPPNRDTFSHQQASWVPAWLGFYFATASQSR